MCGCECCIYDKSIHLSLLSWCDKYLEKLKDQSQNDQNRRSGEKSHHIYETYKNTVMPHGRHIYAKEYDIPQAIMCAYTQYDHAPPHWKFLLRCCTESIHVSIFLTKKHTIIIQTQHPQYSFTFITSLEVVLLMV